MSKAKKKEPKDIITLEERPRVSFVTTGVAELDEITGGYPRGLITQVYGLSSVGKTTLMIKCLAAISQSAKVLYIDVENSLNPDRVAELGGDLLQIDYSNKFILEEVAELVRAQISKYDLIVVDSMAMLVPLAEHSGQTGEQFVGLKPRLLGQFLRQLEGPLAQTQCAFIMINQMRRSMELYGDKWVLPGGLQLKFSSSLMIQLNTVSKDKILKDGRQSGHWITATVTKSKVSKPHLTARFKLLY